MKWGNIVNCIDIKTETVKPFNGTKMFLSTGALDGNTVVMSELIQVTYDNRPSRANLIVHEGDIIFAKMQNTKKVLQIAKENEDFIVSTGFFVVRPRSSLDGEYLFEYLNSDLFNSQKDKFCTGATQKALTNAGLKEILIPLPDIETQKKVAGALKRIRLLTEKRKEQIALLDNALKSWFIYNVGPLSPEYNDWKRVYLKDIAANKKNSMRTGPFGSNLKHSEFVDSGIAVLGIDNAVENKFMWKQRRFVTPEKYEKLKSYTVYPRDVIITIMGTTGRSAVIPDDIPLCINTKHLACITLNNNGRL